MTDREEREEREMELTREQEIEERLEKATPGPWVCNQQSGPVREHWRVFDDGDWAIRRECAPEKLPLIEINKADDHDEATRAEAAHNAMLIAHCPDDLRYLLTENARLRSELSERTSERDRYLFKATCLDRMATEEQKLRSSRSTATPNT